ncbi:MAG: acyl-ACP--UDP-N-acetylglucosamine O-acyltransferase [Acidimicrobiia bacterium]|nr:acyl-ACP--UDP-N-acetylglucosamine O-acyltransferase [Acidimicrobiia bacterium]
MPVDDSVMIAPTARVHPDAVVGRGTIVGEYCVIESDVVIGAHCRLEPYVFVKRWTTMGDGNEISAGTALGTDPLDKDFTGERSYLRIGNRNRIREHYTISRGTKPESVTSIGDDNYIMTSGHIAHNCTLGSRIVIASCTLVAGHVLIEDNAFISGGTLIHQFSRIGRNVMISGNVRVNRDVPPYFLYGESDIEPHGLNLVGLRRAGFTREEILSLRQAYRLLYQCGLKLEEALRRIEQEIPNPHTLHLVRFIRGCERGIARPRGKAPV